MEMKHKFFVPVELLNDIARENSVDLKVLFNNVNEIMEDVSLKLGKVYKTEGGEDLGYSIENVIGLDDYDLFEFWYNDYSDDRCFSVKSIPITDLTKFNEYIARLQSFVNEAIYNNAPRYIALLEAFTLKYEPAENYNMIERSVDGHKVADNKSETTPSGTITNTNVQSGSVKREVITSTNQFNNNASDFVNDSKVVETTTPTLATDTQTTSYTNAKTTTDNTNDRDMSETIAIDSGSETITGQSETTKHILTRRGNIGITTTQQMLESEIELKRFELISDLFKDINEKLLLKTFL